MMDETIASVREQEGDRFEVLGEIAGDPRGGIVCLARDTAQGSLVALVLGKRGPGQGGYSVEVLPELGAAFVTLEAVCDVCGTPATDQSQNCSTCGMRLSSVDPTPLTDRPADEMLHALREAAGDAYEVFGAMARGAGLSPIYFGREKATGNVVPLSPHREGDASGRETLSVGATQLIWMPAPKAAEPAGDPSPTSQAQTTFAAPPGPAPEAPTEVAAPAPEVVASRADVAVPDPEPVASVPDPVASAPEPAVPAPEPAASVPEPVTSTPAPAPVLPVALGPIFGKLPPEEHPPLDPDASSEVEEGHRETFDEIIRAQSSAQTVAADAPAESAPGGWEDVAEAEPETTAAAATTGVASSPVAQVEPAAPVAPTPEVTQAVAESSSAVEVKPDLTPPTPPPSTTKPSRRARRRSSMLPIVVAVLAAVVVGIFTISSSGDIALVQTASAPTVGTETAPAATSTEVEAPVPTEAPPPAAADPSPLIAGATLRIDGALPDFAVVSIDGLVYSARTVSLAPGSHRVFVRADGYLPVDTVIVLEPGRVFALTPGLRRITGAAAATYVSGAVSLDVPLPAPPGDGESVDIPTAPLPSIPEPLGTPRNETAAVVEQPERTAPAPVAVAPAPAPAPTPPPPPAPAPAPAPTPAADPTSPPPPPSVALEPLNIGLNNFAMALQSREIERVAGAYPGMTQSERSTWMEFFGSVTTLSVVLANVQAAPITGDIVQIPFTLVMDFSDRGGASRQLTQNYRATFIQRASGWQIEAIRPN